MDMPLEHARETVMNLYRTKFLREHIGLTERPDICIALEFLIWLKTNHSTVLDFSHSGGDTFYTIRTWLNLHISNSKNP